jgi:membrane protein
VKRIRAVGQVLRDTFSDWQDDECSRLAAALAFYTALSLAPLVLMSIAIAGLAFGQEAAQGQIVSEISGLVGTQGAEAIQTIMASARSTSGGIAATIVGVALLFFGASGVFNELQNAMNRVWEVKPRPGRGVKGVLADRVFSFAMVLAVGFLLLVSMVAGAALSAIIDSIAVPGALSRVLDLLISLVATTGLFALIFRVVPDVKVPWRDVWIGAAVTAVLFALGRFGLGFYLERSSVASSYGAAGSVIAVLVWVYYTAQILFFGAELTQTVARRAGDSVEPDRDAIPLNA